MKSLIYFNKILFVVVVLFMQPSYAQDASISLNILPSGQYTLSDWNNSNINLWQATLINNTAKQKNYNIEMKFYITGSSQPDIWGITQTYILPPGGSQLLNSNNFSYDDMLPGLCAGVCYSQLDDFIESIENSGSLPPGEYTIELIVWENLELYADFLDNSNFIDAKNNSSLDLYSQTFVAKDVAVIRNENITFINLVDPPQNNSIQQPNPWFRWDSPGFAVGIDIIYRLRVYLFHPQFHSTYTDAIEDENFLYYDSGWDEDNIITEIGFSQQVSLQYPSSSRELVCGFKYIWFVEARDVSYAQDEGLWGWPNPVRSTLGLFSYGEDFTVGGLISPQNSSTVETVRPIFNVEPIGCADSYEIWLSESEDSDVENPIWESGGLPTSINTYPFDATGLSPGSTYRWKIRLNPEGEPGPWSDIYNFSIVNYSLDEPSAGQIINTVNPVFNFSGPLDLAGYELRISNSEDSEVESGNIFNQTIESLPFTLPVDIQEGLLPGETYYWKLYFIDGNGNLVGEIEDYFLTSNFIVSEIEITNPIDGAGDLVLSPSFMWDGPMGIAHYKILISSDQDPTVDSPFFVDKIMGTFFQYPEFSDYPLEFGKLYYWKVVPLDTNENEGSSSDIFSFSTANDISSASNETNSIKPEFSLLNGPDTSPKDIIINLLATVNGAEQYIVNFSEDQEIADSFTELIMDANQVQIVLDGDEVKWGTTVYVQIFAVSDNELIGEKSSVQIINIPNKPGSDDQVGINITLPTGSTEPIIEITNLVENAVDYIIEISFDSDMEEIFYTSPAFEDIPNIYSDAAEPLSFGSTYFVQVSAMDDEGIHGIPSSVTSFFIPNAVPPVLIDEFTWEATVPASFLYNINISTTDDFSSIVIDSNVEGLSFTLTDELAPGIVYYWRIRGYQEDGQELGEFSTTKFFETEGTQNQIIDIEGGQIVEIKSPPSGQEVMTLTPTFEWESIEQAEKYEIRIALNEDYSEIIWQSANISINNVQYPSTGSQPLLPETTYYWSVRAISEEIALGEFCQSSTFTISEDNTPMLTGPVDELSETIYPFFTWNKIPRAVSYGLILSNIEDCSQIIFENQNIPQKQFQYSTENPPLEYNSVYYWRVVAYDGEGIALGDYSSIEKFNTPSGIIEIEFIYEEDGE